MIPVPREATDSACVELVSGKKENICRRSATFPFLFVPTWGSRPRLFIGRASGALSIDSDPDSDSDSEYVEIPQ